MGNETLDRLKSAILTYEDEAAEELARLALADSLPPTDVANTVTDAIRQVGEAFGAGDIFLPELLSAAKATKAAMAVIEAELRDTGQEHEPAGTLVIGTVEGDIHDIGKNIVAALFFASGYRVVDLGTSVSPDAFVEAVRDHQPELLGMSALLTTTAAGQKSVIDQLAASGLRDRVKIIVGGAAISKGFAEQIGADGYGPTAFDGVELAARLLETG
jgi:5-methyltetrahydrofolate--homocysteine methyltransferase